MRETVLRLAGAGLLAASGGIHLDLYLTGYRTIHVIGWLFLLQVIVMFVLALAVLVVPARSPAAVSLVALGGAIFAIATLGGYLLSLWFGLFGFREVRTTAGTVAGIIDVAAFAVLAALAAVAFFQSLEAGHRPAPAGRPASRPVAAGIGGIVVIAAAVLAGSVATASGGASGSQAGGALLKTEQVHGAAVLTNSRGFTLYLFVPDSSGRSACYGSCAAYWPPVLGTPVAGAGVTGTLGTIRRTDGGLQATYNGHPLYTYVGDSGPGQANGNNLNLNGGLWREVPSS
jgi:predicted lipoprotein with Yx(FWY)xxD motif